MKLADAPIHIERAKGCYLYASDGGKYLDAVSSWWVNIHGHAHPYIAEKIAQQAKELEHVIFAGFTHTPAITLAEKLLKLLPDNFSKIFYSDNGSTAVEVALKMAIQYWHNIGEKQKIKIIAFENAYHGDTFGAMAVGARNTFNKPFHDLLFEVHYIPVPLENNFTASFEEFEALSEQEDVAAFIFEPLVQGTAGMRMHSAEHLDNLLAIAKKKNIICIADEVMTGFGRTGKIFACEYLHKTPDVICLSKGITGGFMPLGVTACTEKIYNAFYSDEMSKTFFHGHSYTANPLACSAAIASLELLSHETCVKQIAKICSSHVKFADTLKRRDFIKDVRQRGTILAVELNTKEDSSYFNSIRNDIYKFCLAKGVLLRPLGNVIYFMPPYCITQSEMKYVYDVIDDTIFFLEKKYF